MPETHGEETAPGAAAAGAPGDRAMPGDPATTNDPAAAGRTAPGDAAGQAGPVAFGAGRPAGAGDPGEAEELRETGGPAVRSRAAGEAAEARGPAVAESGGAGESADEPHGAGDSEATGPSESGVPGEPGGAARTVGAATGGAPPPPEAAAPSPRLERRADGRLGGGVCRGLAEHLGLDPIIVRLGFAVLISVGVGVIAYVALWLLVPQRPETESRRDWGQLFAYLALICGLSLLIAGDGAFNWAVWPIVAGGVGVGIIWQQADPERRRRWVQSGRTLWLRSIVGALLVIGGLVAFLAKKIHPGQAGEVLLGSGVVLAGVGVVVAPWLLRMWRDLDDERRERIRSQERAEVAAHVHDSVLHTLTLIQRNARDPKEVLRLARAQERDLRAWLYQPAADAEQDIAAAVRKIAAQVEDHHGVAIEVVCVGDGPLDERLGAMLQAAREAMVNAAKYAETPSVSVYAEVEGDQVMIFVRDRGKGFDLDAVPEDRMGVRQSIIGRMERNGGKAAIRTAPGDGTEVRLEMRRS